MVLLLLLVIITIFKVVVHIAVVHIWRENNGML